MVSLDTLIILSSTNWQTCYTRAPKQYVQRWICDFYTLHMRWKYESFQEDLQIEYESSDNSSSKGLEFLLILPCTYPSITVDIYRLSDVSFSLLRVCSFLNLLSQTTGGTMFEVEKLRRLHPIDHQSREIARAIQNPQIDKTFSRHDQVWGILVDLN